MKSSKQLEAEADRLLRESEPKQPYKVLATKISAERARTFEAINAADGVSEYEVIQMLIDVYIRLKDPGQVVSPEMNQLRMVFEMSTDMKKRLRLADPSARVEVREATYFLGDKDIPGCRLRHVYEPFMGDAEQTDNVIEILDRTLSAMPVLYDKLQAAVKKRRLSSIYELLFVMVDELLDGQDAYDIKPTFGDNERSEYGKKMPTTRYKRTMVNSMDAYERKLEAFERRQTTIDFGEEDEIINEIY